MTEIRATNITWHEGHVKREDREKLLAQNGATIWFTGLSVSPMPWVKVRRSLIQLRFGRLAEFTSRADSMTCRYLPSSV